MRSIAAPREKDLVDQAPRDFLNEAKWCREGRWIDGQLINNQGKVIYDPDQVARENRARADYEALERAYRKFRLSIPSFHELEDLRAL